MIISGVLKVMIFEDKMKIEEGFEAAFASFVEKV
jgi:hypothetical protein